MQLKKKYKKNYDEVNNLQKRFILTNTINALTFCSVLHLGKISFYIIFYGLSFFLDLPDLGCLSTRDGDTDVWVVW